MHTECEYKIRFKKDYVFKLLSESCYFGFLGNSSGTLPSININILIINKYYDFYNSPPNLNLVNNKMLLSF